MFGHAATIGRADDCEIAIDRDRAAEAWWRRVARHEPGVLEQQRLGGKRETEEK
jgi:hypothetical protein